MVTKIYCMFGEWQEIREEHLEATDQPEESIQLAKEILNENYQINQTNIEDKEKATENYPKLMNQAKIYAAGYQQEVPNIDLTQPEDYIPKITVRLGLTPEQEDRIMQNALCLAKFRSRKDVKFNGAQPNPKTEAAGLTYIAANNTDSLEGVTHENVAKTIEGIEEGQIQTYNSIIKGKRYPNFLQQGKERIDNKNLQDQLKP